MNVEVIEWQDMAGITSFALRIQTRLSAEEVAQIKAVVPADVQALQLKNDGNTGVWVGGVEYLREAGLIDFADAIEREIARQAGVRASQI